MNTVEAVKMSHFPNNHRHNEIKIEMVQDKYCKALNLYNEDGKLFQSSVIWDKESELTAAYEIELHYKIKYELMDLFKAISNKHKATKRIDKEDLIQVNNLLTDWIAKETVIKQLKEIISKFDNMDIQLIYNRVMNIKGYIDYSIPTTNKDGFYLFTWY